MTHFDITDWVDYVRGLVDADLAARMGLHLTDCTGCAHVEGLLQRVAVSTRWEPGFEPPAELTAQAEAIFPVEAVRRLAPAFTGLRWVTAELLWNSADHALPAGVRSSRIDSGHRSYRSGRYTIDVQLGSDPVAATRTITGQIADTINPDASMGGIEALALAGKRVVGSATTTEFGEFTFRCESGRRLRIVLPLEKTGECVEVQLKFPE